jgi:hypothetical protein
MNRASIRKLYRDAIINVFGCDDKELDAQLLKAIKKDIHLGDAAPGQWSPDSVLEIYCENGIPNATDIHDFTAEAIEFGCDPSNAVSYNSEKWNTIDDLVNLLLEAMGKNERFHHEPFNGGVVGIWRN